LTIGLIFGLAVMIALPGCSDKNPMNPLPTYQTPDDPTPTGPTTAALKKWALHNVIAVDTTCMKNSKGAIIDTCNTGTYWVYKGNNADCIPGTVKMTENDTLYTFCTLPQ
jgi:hypothetical protein